jgi:lysophospholipase L1-like esterase
MDGFAVSNAGIGGDRTIDVAARLPADLMARKVTGALNIATLLVGVNDFHKGATVSETLANMDALVDAVLSDGWELWVMTYPPTRPYTASVRQLNNWIDQNAHSKGYKVIDLYTPMTQTSDNERNPAYCWPNGNQHFPAAGHAVVADLLTSELTQRVAPRGSVGAVSRGC